MSDADNEIEYPKFCPLCGTEIMPALPFMCDNCGVFFEKEESEPPNSPECPID